MRVTVCLLLASLLLPGTGRAAKPVDAERSAAALKGLEMEMQVSKGTPIGGLAEKDFATVPLQ